MKASEPNGKLQDLATEDMTISASRGLIGISDLSNSHQAIIDMTISEVRGLIRISDRRGMLMMTFSASASISNDIRIHMVTNKNSNDIRILMVMKIPMVTNKINNDIRIPMATNKHPLIDRRDSRIFIARRHIKILKEMSISSTILETSKIELRTGRGGKTHLIASLKI